jgi:hypothetical protein
MTSSNLDLTECLDLTVPIVGELTVIEESMEVFGGEKGKDLIDLDETDRKELATLFLVKGGMSGLTKQAKDMEDKAKEVGVPWMMARGVKNCKVPGIGTFSVVNGTSVTISTDKLRKSLLSHGIDAETAKKIVEESTNKSPYTTLQFKAVTSKSAPIED